MYPTYLIKTCERTQIDIDKNIINNLATYIPNNIFQTFENKENTKINELADKIKNNNLELNYYFFYCPRTSTIYN